MTDMIDVVFVLACNPFFWISLVLWFVLRLVMITDDHRIHKLTL